ncbi:ABC transporter permease [Nitriliruptor alkaliphilus]|uniref:ABC transporter permease n=1 Tax=Nitriliruptor alkaliphilus TaxID=427918 RepID=UPI00069805D5|nr:ABC transporter permease [Nitriliruptor alkaliphilus]
MTAVGLLGALVAVLLVPLAYSAVRHRSLASLAVRNIDRRRGEAVLIVAGSLLGTAIITSSLVVGDITSASITDVARTQLGPVDITVTLSDPAEIAAVAAAIDGAGIDGIDGMLTVATADVTMEAPAGPDREARAVPRRSIAEFDVPAGKVLGSDLDVTGLGDLDAPATREVVLNEVTAEKLDVTVGEEVRIHAYGATTELTVVAIVPEVGLAGYGGAIVAPGTLSDLAADATLPAVPPRTSVAVSLEGGVLDTREVSDAVTPALRSLLAEVAEVEVEPVKATLLDDAELQGASLAELFGTIGAFSVLAGILLLVNLFVMLAEERKSELGMLRALGFTRRRLTRAFAIEGAIYATVAAVIGTAAGVGIGWLVALVAGRIWSVADEGLVFRLVIEPTSLAIGGLTGLGIALVTIWLTSVRISRLNVIRAIRDLPEPTTDRVRVRALVLGAVGVVIGAAVTTLGILEEMAVPLVVGVPIAAFSATPLLRRLLPERPARTVVAVVVLAWGIGAFELFGDVLGAADLTVFVAQGIVLTAGAVSLVATLDTAWLAVVDRLASRGRGMAARLGLAYPLARRFRTSMLLGMFSLVLFTMAFISVLSSAFTAQGPAFAADVRGGFDVMIDSNPANPVDASALAARDDVAAVAPLVHTWADFVAGPIEHARGEPITGFDETLLVGDVPALTSRADGYDDDRAVYEAVLADPSLAILPDWFLSGGGADEQQVRAGDSFQVIEPLTGEPRTLTAAAITGSDWVWNGALVSRELTADLFGDRDVAARHYVAVTAGTDADAVAAELDVTLLANGASAASFTAIIDTVLQQQVSFLSLLQGFLGLGLLVGIAGLGVVMIRAVRERRQEIGMLRAMGFPSRLVRTAFLTEAGLIATQGTVIGAVLGVLTARQVLSSSDAFGEADLAFSVPWLGLVVILVVPVLASLLAAVWPAARAAAVRPAVALRTAD